MLKTAKTQKLSSTKIYDLFIELGADKKRAEFAIGEFVKDIPKILASKTKETDLDFTVPSSKGDIWRLESVITENKNDTDLKLAEIKRDLELKIIENKNDLEKTITENKNDLELKIEKIRTEAIENKNDLELKIEKIRTEAIENKNDLELKIAEIKSDLERKIIESKNVLLQWLLGMMTGYTILLIVVLRFFEK